MTSDAALTPAIIATWPVPNYVDPVSQRASIDAAIYATTITMVCFVIARIYVRANQEAGIAAEDWIIVVAAIFGIGMSATLLVLATQSLGRHLYDVKPESLVTFAKINLASIALFNASITFTKMSVCMTYLKLFPSRTNKYFCWTMITYQVLWGVLTSVLYVVQCIPIQSLWDPTITNKTCLDSNQLLTASGILNIVSDFIIFLWPVAPLWQVKLPLPQRLHLISVFSFGVLACVAGILKTVWAQDYFRSWDITWSASRVTIALCIESNVGTMSGCLPCMRPLLAMLAPKLFAGSSAGQSGYPANSGGGSWQRTPFGSKNINSIKLGSGEPSEYDDTHELTDTKNAGAARTWVAGGERVSRPENLPEPGIRVTKDMHISSGSNSPGIMINDGNSEEWIMKEHSMR